MDATRGAMQRCHLLLHLMNVWIPVEGKFDGNKQRFVFGFQADITDLSLGSKDLSGLGKAAEQISEEVIVLFSESVAEEVVVHQ